MVSDLLHVRSQETFQRWPDIFDKLFYLGLLMGNVGGRPIKRTWFITRGADAAEQHRAVSAKIKTL